MSIPGWDINFMLRTRFICALHSINCVISIPYTYLHLKFKNLIESFIVKLDQGFELNVGAIIRFAQEKLHFYKKPGAKPS